MTVIGALLLQHGCLAEHRECWAVRHETEEHMIKITEPKMINFLKVLKQNGEL